MKKCSKCKQEKDVTGFYKDVTAKDGLNCVCKLCRLENDRKRRKNDPVWAIKRKMQNSIYHRKNKDKINQRKKKWLQTEQGKKSKINAKNKYKKENPEKIKAQNAVYHAVKTGKLIRPKHCEICKKECRPEAHHSSYEPEYRLSVNWLCKSCHDQITRRLTKWHN